MTLTFDNVLKFADRNNPAHQAAFKYLDQVLTAQQKAEFGRLWRSQISLVPQEALTLIKQFEGFRANAYICPAGVPTIGYGTTVYANGAKVKMGEKINEAAAENELRNYCEKRILPKLSQLPGWSEMTRGQQAALISFAYNLGESFYGSTGFNTISKALRDRKWDDVPKALLLYVNPGSAFEQGLKRRREAEAKLWNLK